MNKFTITYTDGSLFEGDGFTRDWIKIDDTKEVAQLEYILGDSCITMVGFKQYNHFKECIGLQCKAHAKILLMGRTNGDTLIIVFDLMNKRIEKIEKPYGKEYGDQILAGWKNGKINNPQAFIKEEKIYPNVQ